MDIKNSLEIVAAIKLAGVKGKEILKDGIKADDLPKAFELIKEYQVFVDAATDAKLVVVEAKDIDAQEAVQFYMAFQDAIKAIKEA